MAATVVADAIASASPQGACTSGAQQAAAYVEEPGQRSRCARRWSRARQRRSVGVAQREHKRAAIIQCSAAAAGSECAAMEPTPRRAAATSARPAVDASQQIQRARRWLRLRWQDTEQARPWLGGEATLPAAHAAIWVWLLVRCRWHVIYFLLVPCVAMIE